nr:ABC transporter permease [Collinsella urealyticum]
MLILEQLVGKDFKLKYRRSFLGVAWSVLNPLLMMVIMSIVFSYLFGSNVENFPLYLIVGNVTFTLMADSTNAALTSIIQAAPLLKKIKVHRYIFPVQKVLFALVNYSFSLIAVAIVMLFFRIMPTLNLLWLPVGLLLLMFFCVGVGLTIGALAVFFRDVIHLWGVVLTAWTYLTPIFWDLSLLEAKHAPMWIISLVKINPMYNYLQFMRDIFLWQRPPSPELLGMCTLWAAIAMLIGIFVFRKTEHKFILYV